MFSKTDRWRLSGKFLIFVAGAGVLGLLAPWDKTFPIVDDGVFIVGFPTRYCRYESCRCWCPALSKLHVRPGCVCICLALGPENYSFLKFDIQPCLLACDSSMFGCPLLQGPWDHSFRNLIGSFIVSWSVGSQRQQFVLTKES